MFPLVYSSVFKIPDGYVQPEDAYLAFNTEYPNLNSRDYAKRPINHTLRMHNCWECITLNEEQQVILGTNKLEGREWNSSLWGFENVDELDPDVSCFKLQCKSVISRLRYVAKNIFVMALNSGNLQVWSTRSEVRNPENPYCLFQIGEKCEHMKPIVCMDVMKSNVNKAVTGCKNGTLKIWDMGSADLFSIHTFRFAHKDIITDVDSSSRDDAIFATSSLDKSALLWDVRLTRPAMAICENHRVRFRALSWSSPTEDPQENHIYLGDETGCILALDKRVPNKILESLQVFDRAIRGIMPNGKKIAVFGDTDVVKIFEISEKDPSKSNQLYENADSNDFVRDAVWSSPNELYTVGYGGKLRKHKV